MKQRFSKRTRLVSALLTLAMVFTFLPFSAFAANTEIDFNSPDFQLDFPDAEFQRFLKERCDTNHNGKLDAQELSITEMTITDDYKIKNLEGIRFFEDLEKLDCHGIGLTTLNVGKNFKLRELDCSYNQLKDYLYILSSGLKILNCSHNNLTSMDLGILSGLKLEEVDCSYNKIWRIVMRSEEELIKFDCSNNELTALDVSRCYQLKQLNCSVNQLVELDVKNQTNLTLLDCHHNELIELNVSRNQNLASLTCDGNQLTTLDLSKNNSLSHLSCAENRLACVDFSHMVGSTINADGNRRPIAVRTDGKFDLATLPGFDVSKATNWTGGSVSDTTLSVNAGANEVSYQYNCGNGVKPTFIFETSLPINKNNFPDDSFRNYIKTYKAGGRDVLTVEEQRKVESIEVKGWNISNLKGIEAFPNLKELNCENNSIQKLDLRQNPELEKLICNKNQLTQLDLSKTLTLIRQAVGPNIRLRVDANQGYTVSDAVRTLKAFEKLGVEAVEQCLPSWDLDGMRFVRSKVDLKVMLDESVHTPIDAAKACKIDAADIINIKLMKCGGLYPAEKINAIAEANHVQCMVGCMLETKVAIAAGVGLVAAKQNITEADCDSFMYAVDPEMGMPGGFAVNGGVYTLSDKPGLGIDIDF